MGLDVSHDAWNGAYSRFNRFRATIAASCGGVWFPGGPFSNDKWSYFSAEKVPTEHHAGMAVFMEHSDCDGEISPADCVRVAAWLRWVAPSLPREPEDMASWAERFAAGCEAAAAAGEALGFH